MRRQGGTRRRCGNVGFCAGKFLRVGWYAWNEVNLESE